jgi:hypothetical protein
VYLLRSLLRLVLFPLVPVALLAKWLWLLLASLSKEAPDMALIFAKADNPLEGDRPKATFRGRLNEAMRQAEGWPQAKFLVTGPRHQKDGVSDQKPLWLAAQKYLLAQGIGLGDILVDTSPCFNGQTEIVLAIKTWCRLKRLGQHPELIIVSAGFVRTRSWFCAIWHGCLPTFVWLEEKGSWSWFEEFILTIYSFFDPDWQPFWSLFGWHTRRTREARD